MNNCFSDVYKTLNILCVEDDENVLEVYKKIFSLIFKKVYFAVDGDEGFNSFKENQLDIIITDYQMPKCNGLEMIRKIREIDSSIPIIMVTALESMDMLRDALDLHVTSFLKKPFTSSSLYSSFNLAVKSVIADRYILKEQSQKILYSNYQEELTFSKEKIITKNDAKNKEKIFNFNTQVLYKPKDTLSGDSYIIKKISNDKYFIFLVDGMGKGISASVTAMLCSSFVNYFINKSLENSEEFILEKLLKSLFKFIQPNLLELEIVSAHFLLFDNAKNELQYSIFSMPPILYMREEESVYKIKSNNIPLSSYTKEFTIDKINTKKISKIIIYSDGLNENSIKGFQDTYNSYLTQDFKKANSIDEFELLRKTKIDTQEDDITYVLMTK